MSELRYVFATGAGLVFSIIGGIAALLAWPLNAIRTACCNRLEVCLRIMKENPHD